jgi:4-carboxymuconolactone decarboxylase
VTLLDPIERTQRGVAQQAKLLGAAPTADPATVYEASWRDYVFAEVWARPGLDLRSRFLIAIAGSANAGGPSDLVEGYVRGALTEGELTLTELREATLHLAVYSGWSVGAIMDRAITKVAQDLGLPPAEYVPIRGAAWDPDVRHTEGRANFQSVMLSPGPMPETAYFEAGIVNFVFGEMWRRAGLDERARRWVTLVGVANSSSDIPIRSHTWAAMASGNATQEEMFEFVLQYAIHAGWPRASVMQGVVFEMGERVAKGEGFM